MENSLSTEQISEEIKEIYHADTEKAKQSIETYLELMLKGITQDKKMTVLESQNSGLHDVYASIKDLVSDIEVVKSDYVKSQAELGMIVKELKQSQTQEIESVKEQMESLIVVLTNKVDNSLETLHKHYNIANEDISKSVQFLAKQAQVKKGYSDLES